jgi:hypothetical protein
MWTDLQRTAFGNTTCTKKSSPATRHGGLWGDRRYSSYSFLTSALDGGERSGSRPGRALLRGKDPRYPLYRRLGGPRRIQDKSFAPAGDRTPVVQSVVRHYTDWATPAPTQHVQWLKLNSNHCARTLRYSIKSFNERVIFVFRFFLGVATSTAYVICLYNRFDVILNV